MSLAIVGLLVFKFPTFVHGGEWQKRLIHDLTEKEHNVLERPTANDNSSVNINLAFNLQQIIALDAKQQYLESVIWIEQYWTDYRMKWNPQDYGGIEKIRLPPAHLWRPDILMYNSADQKFDGSWPVNLVVKHNGAISYIPPAMLKSTCRVNVQWFPFDEQCCMMKFGSWTYDDKQVNISVTEVIRNDTYVKNGEFDLAGMMAKRFDDIFTYDEVTENYPYVHICFHLQRLALYYLFNLLLPAVLILCMSLMVFILPVESGEKMGLSITVLLSLSVFSLVVAESLPRTSDSTPLLGIYFTVIMFFCSFAVVISVCVLNLHYFPNLNKNPPDWVRYGVCNYAARALLMRVPDELMQEFNARKAWTSRTAATRRSMSEANNGIDELQAVANLEATAERLRNVQTETETETETESPMSIADCSFPQNDKELLLFASSLNPDKFRQYCSLQIYLILKELQVLSGRTREESRATKVTLTWHFASAVVDRATLYLFMIVTIVFGCFVLNWRPQNLIDEHFKFECPCGANRNPMLQSS